MQRRTFLQLGAGSALLLALAGTAVTTIAPGLQGAALSPRARLVMARIADAILADAWPSMPPAAADQQALLQRVDAQIAAMPGLVQAELSQLLGLMDTLAGRRALVGLASHWEDASLAELTEALQSMRLSRISLRQQAYQGLHDLVYAAYFSGTESWAVLGYPGPVPL